MNSKSHNPNIELLSDQYDQFIYPKPCENIDWKTLLNGQKNLSEITKNLKSNEKENLYKNIHFLLENYVLDYSFFKIENYNKYYTK